MSEIIDYNSMLFEWDKIRAEMAKLKQIESELRKQLYHHFFPSPNYGTNYTELGNSWRLKALVEMNIKVTPEDIVKSQDYLDEYGIPDNVFRTKKELNKTVFKSLDETQQNVVNGIITVKPGSVSLELIRPK